MLNKKYRFHSRGGVRYVYKNGKTIRLSKMSLIFVENMKGFTRFSVVVSKKVDKSAVVRNRIRRRIYEVIRNNFDHIPQKRDYIFVVFSKGIERIPYCELEEMVQKLIIESKI